MTTARRSVMPGRSIQTRVLVGTAVVLLMVVAVLTTALARTSTRLLEEQTRAQMSQLVEQGARSLTDFLDARQANVNLWASDSLTISVLRDPALGAVFMSGLNRYLERYAAQEPWIDEILLIADEDIRFSLSGQGLPSKAEIDAAFAAGAAIGKLIGADGEPPRLAIRAPMTDAGRQIPGQSIVLLLDLAEVDSHLFSDIRPSQTGFVAITDASGLPLLPRAEEASDDARLTETRLLPSFDLAVTGVALRRDVEGPVRRLTALAATFGITAVVLGVLGALVISNRLTAPIRRLTRQARQAARTRTGAASGDPHSADEVRELATLFDQLDRTTSELTEANALLGTRNAELDTTRATLTRNLGRLERELAAARELQLGMVPQPADMGRIDPRLAVAALMEPAREVGGDLYDVFITGPDTCCFMIGDVADKGTASALFMARTLSILRFAVEQASRDGQAIRPADILERTNAALHRHNKARMFVTLILGTLDLRTGDVAYANAGHSDPMIVGRGAGAKQATAPDLPVGVRAATRYRTHLTKLREGQALVLYTDGITEAESADGRFLGVDRLRNVLEQEPPEPEALLAAAQNEVEAFTDGAEPFDDITLLILGIRPTGEAP